MTEKSDGGVQDVRVLSDWTHPTLKEYVDAQLVSIDKRITADVVHAKETALQAQTSAQLANTKSEKASDDRFASHNEFNARIDRILAQTVTLGAFNQFKDQYAADKLQLSTVMNHYVTSEQLVELRTVVAGIMTRQNIGTGEQAGKEKVVDNSRANMAIIISALTALIILLPTVFNAVRPLAQAVAPTVIRETPMYSSPPAVQPVK
jgi:hypothetical protein